MSEPLTKEQALHEWHKELLGDPRFTVHQVHWLLEFMGPTIVSLRDALAKSQREVERLTREQHETRRCNAELGTDNIELRARVTALREHIRAEVIEVTIHGGTICCQCEVIADAGEVLRHAETCILADDGKGQTLKRCWVVLAQDGTPTFADDEQDKSKAERYANERGWSIVPAWYEAPAPEQP